MGLIFWVLVSSDYWFKHTFLFYEQEIIIHDEKKLITNLSILSLTFEEDVWNSDLNLGFMRGRI